MSLTDEEIQRLAENVVTQFETLADLPNTGTHHEVRKLAEVLISKDDV